MKYNFDEVTERRGTGCVKWDTEHPIVNSQALMANGKEMIPLWVADMDFKAAPAI